MRQFAWITVLLTYILMIWGNMVSATGSGLGCPDWPLCHGTIFPPLQFEVILEWGHRWWALIAGTSILITLAMTWRASKLNHTLRSVFLKGVGILLVVQILLGGLTVYLGLSLAASTVHLLVANLVFALIISIATTLTWGHRMVLNPSPKFKRLISVGLIGIIGQIVLGGLVRHGHAGLACPRFPFCGTEFFPQVWMYETSVAFIHRWWGIMLLGFFVQMVIYARKYAPRLKPLTAVALGLCVSQILFGIATVHTGLETSVRGFHAALGYGLWGITIFIALRSGTLDWLLESKKEPVLTTSGLTYGR